MPEVLIEGRRMNRGSTGFLELGDYSLWHCTIEYVAVMHLSTSLGLYKFHKVTLNINCGHQLIKTVEYFRYWLARQTRLPAFVEINKINLKSQKNFSDVVESNSMAALYWVVREDLSTNLRAECKMLAI